MSHLTQQKHFHVLNFRGRNETILSLRSDIMFKLSNPVSQNISSKTLKLKIKESDEAGSKDQSSPEPQANTDVDLDNQLVDITGDIKVLMESEAEDFQVPVTSK